MNFIEWHKEQDTYCQGLTKSAWDFQQKKIDDLREALDTSITQRAELCKFTERLRKELKDLKAER